MEQTIKKERVFNGKLLKVDSYVVRLDDGSESVREVIDHPGAAVVLAQDEATGDFILVKQYRKAVESYLFEAVAGTLERNEEPEACAAREVQEEIGMCIGSLELLGTILPAPGYTSEKLYIYLAKVIEGKIEYFADEDERIESYRLSKKDIDAMIMNGEIEDAKTICAWYFYNVRYR